MTNICVCRRMARRSRYILSFLRVAAPFLPVRYRTVYAVALHACSLTCLFPPGAAFKFQLIHI